MGAVRTTFAMVAASLVRRKQVIDKGLPDPYAPKSMNNTVPISSHSTPMGSSTASISRLLCFVTNFIFNRSANESSWVSSQSLKISHCVDACFP